MSSNEEMTLRWSMEKGGIRYYVYHPYLPTHLRHYGYTDFQPAGYFDHLSCTIKDDPEVYTYEDFRVAPGA